MPSIEESLPLTIASLKQLEHRPTVDQVEQSIRLWLLIRKLYSGEWSLPNKFGYEKDIRPWLFSKQHPQRDSSKKTENLCPDPACICHQSLRTLVSQYEEMPDLSKKLNLTQGEWQKLLDTKPFNYSHRTLRESLNQLVALGWLQKSEDSRTDSRKFYLCPPDTWPLAKHQDQSPLQQMVRLTDLLSDLAFMDPEIAVILDTIQDQYTPNKRLYYRTEYIINDENNEVVEDIQERLFQTWKQTPVPPIRIQYQTRHQGCQSFIVYPVCLFYARRAKYLSAYGQSPNPDYDWHHFRLDRIESLETLAWRDPRIPDVLRQAKQQQNLPTPETVTNGWEEAWGTDFYLPKALLLLRFPPDFAQRYVLNTQRHASFKPISYNNIPKLVHKVVIDPQEQQHILEIIQRRPATDVYFRAWVRVGDTDLTMRLRDWRPNGEVIAPIGIRNQMRQEAEQELYHYR
jgi:CRISPR-associated protein (TIGR03985 family)